MNNCSNIPVKRPRIMRVAMFVALFFSFSFLSCSDDPFDINSPVSSGPFDGTLYVIPGGIGNGSLEAPLGSVQRALETAFRNPEIRIINIAAGDYNGSPRIKSGVTINGSLDPANGWEKSSSGKTIIRGAMLDSLAIGFMVRNISKTVILRNITIIGGPANDSSSTSIGLYCQNAGDIRLIDCEIVGGDGMTGRTGKVGIDGQSGVDADKSLPGLTPVPGGRGGDGGARNITFQVPGFAGENGFCFDSMMTGGIGGAVSSDVNGTDGQDGPDGTIGTAGSRGNANLTVNFINPYVFLNTEGGGTGQVGEYGCGGGGGNGSWSIWNPNPAFSFNGIPGGGGGAGGSPGTGGIGGEGGGSSVGILVYESSISLSNCIVRSRAGGDGGNGGAGGRGGSGGIGGEVPFVLLKGGKGGKGGTAGNGGSGGGGSGGWSAGIVLFSAIIDSSQVTFDLGQAGAGGQSNGSANSQGQMGQSTNIFTIQ